MQVALALVLLICSGLMIRTFGALPKSIPVSHMPPNCNPSGSSFQNPGQGGRTSSPHEEEILHKIEAVPGVSSVSIASKIPMDSQVWYDPVFVEGRTYAEGEIPPLRRFKFVSPGFLETFGAPLVAGRLFTWAETYKKLPLALVSENFAREILARSRYRPGQTYSRQQQRRLARNHRRCRQHLL